MMLMMMASLEDEDDCIDYDDDDGDEDLDVFFKSDFAAARNQYFTSLQQSAKTISMKYFSI